MTDTNHSFHHGAEAVFQAQMQSLRISTDRMFGALMLMQWLACIAAAIVISPRTWEGSISQPHLHVWAAVLLGGSLALYPIYLVLRRAGSGATRNVIAVAQILFGSLLIHLTGGRIETHFHVFGSLAFIAFYRQRSLLLLAAAVVVVDHLARGVFWPQSIYGVLSTSIWRSFEHAGWVVFELVFLIIATNRSRREMWMSADREARLDAAHRDVEQKVDERTSELRLAEARTRAILDTAADGIVTMDEHGNVQSFNPAAERIFGYRAAEVVGQHVAMLIPAPDDAPEAGYLTIHLDSDDERGAGIGREVVGRRKDGSTFPLDLAVSESQGGVFTSIVRDITERQAIDRMKTEFISTVSHELRTPLTSIRGSLGLIRGGIAGELGPKAQSLIDIAEKNSDRLVRLVNDILDIEKIESGNMEFRFEAQDVLDIVQEACRANESFAQQHGVDIEIGETVVDAQCQVDRDRIVQVLTNLISNAAKFSPPGESVRLSMHRHDDQLRVEVSDRGPGIPVEFRSRIFGKFAQADSADTRQKEGTGLGLSISKAIVEKHGGEAGFHTVEGEGTTFYFTLPIATPVTTVVAPQVEGGGPRVLVCEDDRDISHLLTLMLQQAGAVVDVVGTADEARELLSQREYAVMTLDLMLPGESGLDLLRALRADPATSSLPVVVVSAKASEGRKERDCEALGVIGWLDKPIDQDDLFDSVNHAIRRVGACADEGRRARVLHLEDNDDLASIVADTLEPVATVRSARNVAEARHMLTSERFDVLLLDLELPDGCGLELLSLLGKSNAGTPVVVFSAREPTADVTKRVSASLVKSRTSNEQLVDTITSLLRDAAAAESKPALARSPSWPIR